MIQYSKQAIKFLKKQDVPTRKRIVTAINNLPSGDVKKCREPKDIVYELVTSEYYLIKMAIFLV